VQRDTGRFSSDIRDEVDEILKQLNFFTREMIVGVSSDRRGGGGDRAAPFGGEGREGGMVRKGRRRRRRRGGWVGCGGERVTIGGRMLRKKEKECRRSYLIGTNDSLECIGCRLQLIWSSICGRWRRRWG
jgi:hypothetical protein